MQDKSMQRERDQTDRTLERLRKIERQIYDEQYWDEVAQVPPARSRFGIVAWQFIIRGEIRSTAQCKQVTVP